MKERLDMLWGEFQLPIWVTEFDWNADQTAHFGDHSQHAQILDNFYRLTFSHQVPPVALSHSQLSCAGSPGHPQLED